MSEAAPCPCGSGVTYAACCGRWQAGEPAPTPEVLMRSRYAAFVMRDEAYLLATWHASRRPTSVSLDRATKWLGLRIVAAPAARDDAGEVEFIARFRVGGGRAARLHELSRFVREAGRWYYIDGVMR